MTFVDKNGMVLLLLNIKGKETHLVEIPRDFKIMHGIYP